MEFIYNDGGRADAGYTTSAGDCVARSVAIVTGRPYKEVYERLTQGNKTQRLPKGFKKKVRDKVASLGYGENMRDFNAEVRRRIAMSRHTASHGVTTKRKWFQDYMTELGYTWVPTMKIGSGCQVHLRADELPGGRIIVNVSRHYTAVIDGVLHDTYDCSRGGTRCVYGYYIKK